MIKKSNKVAISDFTEDDSGIAIKTEQGLFVMSGWGYRGVCNTIEHAKRVINLIFYAKIYSAIASNK